MNTPKKKQHREFIKEMRISRKLHISSSVLINEMFVVPFCSYLLSVERSFSFLHGHLGVLMKLDEKQFLVSFFIKQKIFCVKHNEKVIGSGFNFCEIE